MTIPDSGSGGLAGQEAGRGSRRAVWPLWELKKFNTSQLNQLKKLKKLPFGWDPLRTNFFNFFNWFDWEVLNFFNSQGVVQAMDWLSLRVRLATGLENGLKWLLGTLWELKKFNTSQLNQLKKLKKLPSGRDPPGTIFFNLFNWFSWEVLNFFNYEGVPAQLKKLKKIKKNKKIKKSRSQILAPAPLAIPNQWKTVISLKASLDFHKF